MELQWKESAAQDVVDVNHTEPTEWERFALALVEQPGTWFDLEFHGGSPLSSAKVLEHLDPFVPQRRDGSKFEVAKVGDGRDVLTKARYVNTDVELHERARSRDLDRPRT